MRSAMNRLWGILCYPFGGMGFYRTDSFEKLCLAHREEVKKGGAIGKSRIEQDLFRQMQKALLPDCPANYDEMALLFRRYYEKRMNRYFGADSSKIGDVHDIYLELIAMVSGAFLSLRDGKIIYKYWKSEKDAELLQGFDECDKILLYHALQRQIPADLLIASYMLDNRGLADDKGEWLLRQYNGYREEVDIADLQLDLVLNKGVAENHVHLNGASNFSFEWQGLMKWPEEWRTELRKWDGCDSYGMYESILTAAIIRNAASIYLGCAKKGNFLGMWDAAEHKVFEILHTAHRKSGRGDVAGQTEASLQEGVLGFLRGCFVCGKEEDTAARHLGAGRKKNVEILFLYRAMQYIRMHGKEDPAFSVLFFQYLRIKHEVYHRLVQNNGMRGLDYFQNFFSRNKKLLQGRRKSEDQIVADVMEVQFANEDLKKIEFRTGPGQSQESMLRGLYHFLKGYYQIIRENYCVCGADGSMEVKREFPRAGIVYHLIKREDRCSYLRCWKNYIRQGFELGKGTIRFLELQEKYLQQIEWIKELRKKDPRLANYVVGLDAASGENATPVWVFAPVFECARDGSDDVLDSLGKKVRNLRFTFHAGEDFRHILSGIRRMDEVLRYCKFHAGDRIGHGVALGIRPEEWASAQRMAVIPRGEFLENLLWAWMLLCEEPHDMDGIKFYMEQKIYQCAKEIYGNTEGITVNLLLEAYQMQFQKKIRDWGYEKYLGEDVKHTENRVFCAFAKPSDAILWNAEKLLISRHCACYASRMEETLYYKVTKQEIRIAQLVQGIVREKVSRLGVVVEVCPSSNTVITYADTLFKNQAFVLNGFLKDAGNVMLCINSDDPAVCAANVSNELAYVYYGLMANGMSKEDALIWIDRVRQNGMDMSFVQDGRTKEEIVEELEEILDGRI